MKDNENIIYDEIAYADSSNEKDDNKNYKRIGLAIAGTVGVVSAAGTGLLARSCIGDKAALILTGALIVPCALASIVLYSLCAINSDYY